MLKSGFLVVVSLASACAATSAEVKQARHAAYQGDYEQVWSAAVASLAEEYPIVKLIDKDGGRIVTCWRPIDRDAQVIRTASIGSGWRLYRAIVEISRQAPYRVTVSGRSAEYQPPLIRPIQYGDLSEPGWREGRTDKIAVKIYARLRGMATTTTDEAASPADPTQAETFSETCIMRPERIGAGSLPGMQGIAIGSKGAMGMP